MAKQHKRPPRLDCQARLPSILQPANIAGPAVSIDCSLDLGTCSSAPAVLLFPKHTSIGKSLHLFVARTPSGFRPRFLMQQECINISHSRNALREDVHLYVIKCLMTKFYAEMWIWECKNRSIYDYPLERSAKKKLEWEKNPLFSPFIHIKSQLFEVCFIIFIII